jgi:hypothetical protein|nr:MAG: hypothetical protein [Bacteriophage sp.]
MEEEVICAGSAKIVKGKGIMPRDKDY